MKRLTHILALITLVLFAGSCVKELLPERTEGPDVSEGDQVTLFFDLGLSSRESDSWGEARVETKALGELEDIRRLSLKLRLYVFDESGFLLEEKDATLMENHNSFETSKRNETQFSVQLSRSNNPRIIHFVAVDAAGGEYDDVVHEAYHYGSETTFMSGLSVTNNVDAYWARMEKSKIDGPTDDEPDVTPTTFERVPMIRNFAKVTLEEPTLENFTLTGFALVNVPAHGSVAPYNSTNGSFVQYFIDYPDNPDVTEGGTLAYNNVKSYKEITASGYQGCLPLGISAGNMWTSIASSLGSGSFTTEAKFLYESPNSVGDTKGKTFLIIKGNYKKSETETLNDRYYKVDIIYKDETTGVPTYYNILRNFNYIIKINGVTFEGYDSPAAAAAKPASNNISASVLAEGVNNVSDGNGQRRLFVNKTYALYTAGGDISGDLKAKAVMSNGTMALTDNLKLTVLEDNDGIIQSGPALSATLDSENYRNINLVLNAADDVPKSATLRVYVQEGDYETLFRDITIVLRKPYDLRVDCTDVVNKSAGSELNARLLLPDGINKALFPLSFMMESAAKTISPYASKNQLAVNVANSIVPGNEGTSSFQYIREVTYDEYNSASTKTIGTTKYRILDCFFKTSVAASATTVYAVNDYFSRTNAQDAFKNGDPVFLDGDDAYAVIYASDYYGARNSYNYVEFKTVRNSGTVSVTLSEEGQETTVGSFNLSGGSVAGEGQYYLHHLDILTKTFKGSNYHVSVTYSDGDYTQTIEGSATQKRRYLYLPLGSFQTNVNNTNGYLTEEYFRSCINVASTQWAVSGAQAEYMGKVFMSENGVNYAYARAAEYDTDYHGYKFANDAGYHMSIDAFHPDMELTEDMVIHFYDPQSKKNETWVANARVGDVTARHAIDFQANATDNAAAPANGLFKMQLTFAAPTP